MLFVGMGLVTICVQTILQDFFLRSYAMFWLGFTEIENSMDSS